jgi:hypothetical protein
LRTAKRAAHLSFLPTLSSGSRTGPLLLFLGFF